MNADHGSPIFVCVTVVCSVVIFVRSRYRCPPDLAGASRSCIVSGTDDHPERVPPCRLTGVSVPLVRTSVAVARSWMFVLNASFASDLGEFWVVAFS